VARKNLLAGLIGSKLPDGNLDERSLSHRGSDREPAVRLGSVGNRGAIGAVTRSIESLKSAASEAEQMRAQLEAGQVVLELDPALVDPSPVADRMGDTTADASEFMEAIRITGQQVPILVRPHPDLLARYQIAYGHRRVRAARELGRPVRAIVRQMSDAELVVAQGQENSARLDLSFIERALYAAKLEEAGFDRETIMAALNVDKTGLSRLISVAVKIPRDVIEAIGPAPKIGRDRWTDLVVKLDSAKSLDRVRDALIRDEFVTADTNARFEIILRASQVPRAKAKPHGRRLTNSEGKPIGKIERAGKGARLVLNEGSFADFLAEHLPRLHAEWRTAEYDDHARGGATTTGR
jgi:ParB family transcriptional regulator, chromosome partitioning protein